MKWISYLCAGCTAILILTSCFLNPHDKARFDEFHNQSISLLGNLIFYHFNELTYPGGGGDIIDSSGFGKNSDSVNGLQNAEGIYGYGIECNDANMSGVDLQVADFDLAFTERTISIWFVAYATDGVRYVYEEGGGVNGINIYIQDGLLYGHTYKASAADFQAFHSYPVETNTWYHAVITFSQTGGFLLYINGEPTGAAQPLGLGMPGHGDPNALCFQNAGSFRHTGAVGGCGGGCNYFSGILDELAVWNRLLSATEVRNLYLRQGRL